MLRVIKLGGSLLTWDDFPTALKNWLEHQPPAFNVVVVGGGALADAIRLADTTFDIGDESAHWLCIDAMSINTRIAAAALLSFPLVTKYDDLRVRIAAAAPKTAFFDPRDFLIHHEPHCTGQKLPHDWSVTSDSIAARLAETIAATELVLLKSADAPTKTLSELAKLGYIDRHLPVTSTLPTTVRFVNLRRVEKSPIQNPKSKIPPASSALASHSPVRIR